jgi:hypothetical protein
MNALTNTAYTSLPVVLTGHVSGQAVTLPYGFTLTQVAISPFSTLRGRFIDSLELPANHRVMGLIRPEGVVTDTRAEFFRTGDIAVVMTDDPEWTRRLFLF